SGRVTSESASSAIDCMTSFLASQASSCSASSAFSEALGMANPDTSPWMYSPLSAVGNPNCRYSKSSVVEVLVSCGAQEPMNSRSASPAAHRSCICGNLDPKLPGAQKS